MAATVLSATKRKEFRPFGANVHEFLVAVLGPEGEQLHLMHAKYTRPTQPHHYKFENVHLNNQMISNINTHTFPRKLVHVHSKM
jgi:hypothetical protein